MTLDWSMLNCDNCGEPTLWRHPCPCGCDLRVCPRCVRSIAKHLDENPSIPRRSPVPGEGDGASIENQDS